MNAANMGRVNRHSARYPSDCVVAVGACFLLFISCGSEQKEEAAHSEPSAAAESQFAAEPRTPNVLWITIDTLRADHLGCYGYPRETTPWLDELAAESLVFERAFTPIATTLPSHTSMFTGVYPHEHGILANIAGGQTYLRNPELLTLAEVLRQGGYATRAVISAFPLREEFGLATGFDIYHQPKARKQRGAKAATKAALNALKELQDPAVDGAPGFLWVHYFDPHVPYSPPPEYRDRFQMTEEELAGFVARGFLERAQRRTGEWNELDKGTDFYDEEVAFADFEIARLMREAKASGWLDDAIIIVTADHGEGLNQHGMPGHGFVWQEQLRVPLIMRIPGEEAGRVPYSMSLVDVAPTLLRFIDVPGKAEFLEQATGVDRLDPSISHVDARILGQGSPLQSTDGNIDYTLRAGGWNLHLAPNGIRRLYRVDTDPDETVDLAESEAAIADRLEKELREWVALQRREVTTEAASDAVRAELRALGYGGSEDDEEGDR